MSVTLLCTIFYVYIWTCLSEINLYIYYFYIVPVSADYINIILILILILILSNNASGVIRDV